MEAAAAAFDQAEPPPALKTALQLRRWGDVDIMNMPARLAREMSITTNVYDAVSSYLSAKGNSVDWTNRNPSAWNLVSYLLAERRNGTK